MTKKILNEPIHILHDGCCIVEADDVHKECLPHEGDSEADNCWERPNQEIKHSRNIHKEGALINEKNYFIFCTLGSFFLFHFM